MYPRRGLHNVFDFCRYLSIFCCDPHPHQYICKHAFGVGRRILYMLEVPPYSGKYLHFVSHGLHEFMALFVGRNSARACGWLASSIGTRPLQHSKRDFGCGRWYCRPLLMATRVSIPSGRFWYTEILESENYWKKS